MFGKPLFPTYNLKQNYRKQSPPSKFESTLPSSSAEDDPPIDQVITKRTGSKLPLPPSNTKARPIIVTNKNNVAYLVIQYYPNNSKEQATTKLMARLFAFTYDI
jgi:hypothetical protein